MGADRIAWLRQVLDWKDAVADASEWLTAFRSSLFTETIYVLTPQGRVVSLDRGATPVGRFEGIYIEVVIQEHAAPGGRNTYRLFAKPHLLDHFHEQPVDYAVPASRAVVCRLEIAALAFESVVETAGFAMRNFPHICAPRS